MFELTCLASSQAAVQAQGVAVPSCWDPEGGNAVILCILQILQSL